MNTGSKGITRSKNHSFRHKSRARIGGFIRIIRQLLQRKFAIYYIVLIVYGVVKIPAVIFPAWVLVTCFILVSKISARSYFRIAP